MATLIWGRFQDAQNSIRTPSGKVRRICFEVERDLSNLRLGFSSLEQFAHLQFQVPFSMFFPGAQRGYDRNNRSLILRIDSFLMD